MPTPPWQWDPGMAARKSSWLSEPANATDPRWDRVSEEMNVYLALEEGKKSASSATALANELDPHVRYQEAIRNIDPEQVGKAFPSQGLPPSRAADLQAMEPFPWYEPQGVEPEIAEQMWELASLTAAKHGYPIERVSQGGGNFDIERMRRVGQTAAERVVTGGVLGQATRDMLPWFQNSEGQAMVSDLQGMGLVADNKGLAEQAIANNPGANAAGSLLGGALVGGLAATGAGAIVPGARVAQLATSLGNRVGTSTAMKLVSGGFFGGAMGEGLAQGVEAGASAIRGEPTQTLGEAAWDVGVAGGIGGPTGLVFSGTPLALKDKIKTYNLLRSPTANIQQQATFGRKLERGSLAGEALGGDYDAAAAHVLSGIDAGPGAAAAGQKSLQGNRTVGGVVTPIAPDEQSAAAVADDLLERGYQRDLLLDQLHNEANAKFAATKEGATPRPLKTTQSRIYDIFRRKSQLPEKFQALARSWFWDLSDVEIHTTANNAHQAAARGGGQVFTTPELMAQGLDSPVLRGTIQRSGFNPDMVLGDVRAPVDPTLPPGQPSMITRHLAGDTIATPLSGPRSARQTISMTRPGMTEVEEPIGPVQGSGAAPDLEMEGVVRPPREVTIRGQKVLIDAGTGRILPKTLAPSGQLSTLGGDVGIRSKGPGSRTIGPGTTAGPTPPLATGRGRGQSLIPPERPVRNPGVGGGERPTDTRSAMLAGEALAGEPTSIRPGISSGPASRGVAGARGRTPVSTRPLGRSEFPVDAGEGPPAVFEAEGGAQGLTGPSLLPSLPGPPGLGLPGLPGRQGPTRSLYVVVKPKAQNSAEYDTLLQQVENQIKVEPEAANEYANMAEAIREDRKQFGAYWAGEKKAMEEARAGLERGKSGIGVKGPIPSSSQNRVPQRQAAINALKGYGSGRDIDADISNLATMLGADLRALGLVATTSAAQRTRAPLPGGLTQAAGRFGTRAAQAALAPAGRRAGLVGSAAGQAQSEEERPPPLMTSPWLLFDDAVRRSTGKGIR